jgi:hypothetical protein
MPVVNVDTDKLLRNISITNMRDLMDMILKDRTREDIKCHMFWIFASFCKIAACHVILLGITDTNSNTTDHIDITLTKFSLLSEVDYSGVYNSCDKAFEYACCRDVRVLNINHDFQWLVGKLCILNILAIYAEECSDLWQSTTQFFCLCCLWIFSQFSSTIFSVCYKIE